MLLLLPVLYVGSYLVMVERTPVLFSMHGISKTQSTVIVHYRIGGRYAELYRMGAIQKPEDVAQAMERIEKEAIRMGALVSDLLALARLDDTKPLEAGPVDLVPLARDAALDAMAGAPDREVTVAIDEATASDTAATDAPPPAATGPEPTTS